MSQLKVLQDAWCISLEEELKKDPAIKRSSIDEVQAWCRRQVYLPPVSEHTIALFLKLASYNEEKAAVYIDNHYTFRTYYRSIFSDRDPEHNDVKEAMNTIHCSVLPGLTANRRRVLYASLKTTDSSKFSASQCAKYIYMTADREILVNGFGDVDSYAVLFDAKGFGLGHLSSITISFLKQLFSYFLDGANLAIKEINVINVNSVVEKLVQIIKGFAPRDLYERIHLYTKDKTAICLAKFPADILPTELGGNAKLCIQEMTDLNEQQVKEFRLWYLADEAHLRVDEAKRPREDQNKKVVKLQASIKKLELD